MSNITSEQMMLMEDVCNQLVKRLISPSLTISDAACALDMALIIPVDGLIKSFSDTGQKEILKDFIIIGTFQILKEVYKRKSVEMN